MPKKRMTKMERFIRRLAGPLPCPVAQRAIQRYRCMTVQQAWRKADMYELRGLCQGFPFCWCHRESAGDIRKRHPTPPAAVMRAYRRIK